MMNYCPDQNLKLPAQWLHYLTNSLRWIGLLSLISLMLFTTIAQAATQSTERVSPRVAALRDAIPEPCNLDFDGNGMEDALTDGVLFVRYLSGYADASLVDGALGAGATRTTGAEVSAFLDQADCTAMKDADGDGTIDAQTDGILLMRYLFGLSGHALTHNALSLTAKRTTPSNIQNRFAFYQQPRYSIIDGSIAGGERISDPWEDVVVEGLGPGTSTVRVVEGLNYSGNPMFHWSLSGDQVKIAMPNPNLLAGSSESSSGNIRATQNPSERYPLKSVWAYGRSYFAQTASLFGWNRLPMFRIGTRGELVSGGEIAGIEYEWEFPIGDAYELLSSCDKKVESCYKNTTKEPVLFIHGFLAEMPWSSRPLGGGKGTWGLFPKMLEDLNYLTFEWRWNTSARFNDVATELGYAIEHITEVTGKEVHLVAHSFGGILVRTLLQQQAYANNKDYSHYIATVTTLGTPHSGIADENKCMHGVEFPLGQDGTAMFNGCDQLSCQQVGEDMLDAVDAKVYGVADAEGGLIAKLAETANNLPDVDILSLIGLTTHRGPNDVIDEGDGLISGWGQRFRPEDASDGTCGSVSTSWKPLLTNVFMGNHEGAARVTEYVLGFGTAKPGGSNPDPDFLGYRHTSTVEVVRGVIREAHVENKEDNRAIYHDGFTQTAKWLGTHISYPVVLSDTLPFTLRTTDPDGNPVGNVQVSVFRVGGAGSMVATGLTGQSDGTITLDVPFEADHRFGVLITPSTTYRNQQRQVETLATVGMSLSVAQMGDIVLTPEDPTPGQLSGHVSDGVSGGSDLAGVRVVVQRTDHAIVDWQGDTNANGQWGPLPLIPGAYQITLSKSGYQAKSKTVVVQSSKTATIDSHLVEGADIKTGLVAHYKFDGSFRDSSLNGHHGIKSDDGVTFADGVIGSQAASFDGVNGYIQTPLTPVYQVSDPFTIAAWINSRNTSNSDAAILGFERSNHQELSISVRRSDLNSIGRFYLRDDDWNASDATTTQSLNDSKWHFITAVRDPSVDKLHLYIDGILIDTVDDISESAINQTSSRWLAIGGSNNSSRGVISRFTGEIDDVRIYNRALSQSEVQQLYAHSTNLENGLVAHYEFNGDATDATGNGHDGTIVGSVTPTVDRFGNRNATYSFGDRDGYIDIAKPEDFEFSNNFSISIWYKSTKDVNVLLGTRLEVAANKYSGYMIQTYGTHNNTWDGVNFFGALNSSTGIGTGVQGYHDQEWHHVAVLNSDQFGTQLYVDGKLKASDVNTDPIFYDPSVSSYLNIGGWADSSVFSGSMDDLRIYSRTLSYSEVQGLYSFNNPVDISSGLVAYYPFNGNANDESENGNDGTVNGATMTKDRFGKDNSAYSFSSTVSNIGLGNIITDFHEITISTYVKRNDSSLGGHIISNDRAGYKDDFLLGIGGSNWNVSATNKINLVFQSAATSTHHEIVSDTEVPVNTWIHVAGTLGSDGMKLYIDGQLQSTTTSYAVSSTNGQNNWHIHGNPSGSYSDSNIDVDEVRFYDRVLSS